MRGNNRRSAQRLWVFLGVIVTLGGSTAPLLAQSTAPFPGTDPQNQEFEDVWNNRNENGGSLFSIINRLQLLNGRSPGEFQEEQAENFDSAVSDFRQKQLEKINSTEPTLPTFETDAPSAP